jgi:hypothetical protein
MAWVALTGRQTQHALGLKARCGRSIVCAGSVPSSWLTHTIPMTL